MGDKNQKEGVREKKKRGGSISIPEGKGEKRGDSFTLFINGGG